MNQTSRDPIEMARYLARNTNLIARSESAGSFFTRVERLVADIERCINRPEPKKICGKCLYVDDDRNLCDVVLYANHNDIETTCPRCGTVYNVEDLIKKSLASLPKYELLYTAAEVLEEMAELGMPIKERTWRRWRASGQIEARNEWGSEVRFKLNDVVSLYNKSDRSAA